MREHGAVSVPKSPTIVLLGLMGTGKSSIGRALATRIGGTYSDSDEFIQRTTGETARELLADEGVAAVHGAERAHLLAELGAIHDGVRVVGAAASVVDTAEVRAAIRRSGAKVVWLRARLDTLVRRFEDAVQGGHRPRYDNDLDAMFREQISRRARWYESLADVTVDTDDADAATIAARLASDLTRDPAAGR